MAKSPDRKRLSDDVRRRQIKARTDRSKDKGSQKRSARRGKPREVTLDELKSEYSYVLKDLRRIFILAGVMFVLLIAVNIVFPLIF